MKLIDQKQSALDTTRKFVFELRGEEVEFSYINKGDGKDIIVVPCQTSCNVGCTFCFLTGMDLPVLNLTGTDIVDGVRQVIREAELPQSEDLLVSFMGSGEPLLNYRNVLDACRQIYGFPARDTEGNYYQIRFAVSTMIPNESLMQEFIKASKALPIKLHLSLHSPFDDRRREVMPNAANVQTSLELLREFKYSRPAEIKRTEIHYTLIDGFNDRDEDAQEIIKLFEAVGLGTTVKFLDFKTPPGSESIGSTRVEEFRAQLHNAGIKTEFYNPPGSDIGSSCGQFIRTKATSATA